MYYKNLWSYLLHKLLKEEIDKDKQGIKEDIVYCLCAYSLRGVNPNEIDSSSMHIDGEDEKRYFVTVKMKHGNELTVPIEKRYLRNRSVDKLNSFS